MILNKKSENIFKNISVLLKTYRKSQNAISNLSLLT